MIKKVIQLKSTKSDKSKIDLYFPLLLPALIFLGGLAYLTLLMLF